MKTLLVLILISFSCQTLRQEKGSISKQIDSIEDICSNPNLEKSIQERCKKVLGNIRTSEQAKDRDIINATNEANESKSIAFSKTEQAGKWVGARNIVILIGILLFLILSAYAYLKGMIPKIPLI